jgi:hypothetical protein
MVTYSRFEEGVLVAADRRHQADIERLLAQAPRSPLSSFRQRLAAQLRYVGEVSAHAAHRLDPNGHSFRGAGNL